MHARALLFTPSNKLPTVTDQFACPSVDAPLFALVMTAALRDAGAL